MGGPEADTEKEEGEAGSPDSGVVLHALQAAGPRGLGEEGALLPDRAVEVLGDAGPRSGHDHIPLRLNAPQQHLYNPVQVKNQYGTQRNKAR
jgi:hypothetical protein